MTARLSLCLGLLLAIGCDGVTVSCGEGTTLIDGVCVADTGEMPPPADAGAPLYGEDAGEPPPPPEDAGVADGGAPPTETDAGEPSDDDAGTEDAGTEDAGTEDAGTEDAGADDGGSPPPPSGGCDVASGECAVWADSIVELLAGARSCRELLRRDAGADRVAQQHADHQAEQDAVTVSSPEGDLFTQLRETGATYSNAGALVGASRRSALRIVDSWHAHADTATLLDPCWTGIGVAVATSESGTSYATVLLTR